MNTVIKKTDAPLPCRAVFQPQPGWTSAAHGDITLYHAGVLQHMPEIVQALLARDFEALSKLLKAQQMNFGLMAAAADFALAAADRVRAFPVFYIPAHKALGNHAQALAALESSPEAFKVHDTGLLSFCMAGFALGSMSLYESLQGLRPGQWLLMTQTECQVNTYYEYAPHPENTCDEEEKLRQLDHALNEAIARTIEQAGGAPIWVPLSGGYDSRLILCKFHEHGYQNLHSFSYGVRGNFEARCARKIAAMLGVPWHMVPAQPARAYALYHSALRQDYEDFCHGYTQIPSYVEFEALHALKEIAPAGSYIVNGQTGDFLSGGHIPKVLMEGTDPQEQDVLDYITEKHFSLWTSLKTPEYVKNIQDAVRPLLLADDRNLTKRENLMRAYEHFEWAERQAKVVVQGQRLYEFFGFNWALPLWDAALMDFFETLPFEDKYQQRLFKKYLHQYNYMRVFDEPKAKPENWAWYQRWRVLWANILGLVCGGEAKADFYKKALYDGHAHNQYALMGRKIYNQHYKEIRNIISLSVLDFCTRKGLKFPGS